MASTPILPLAVWLPGTNQNSIPANDNALRLEALNREIVSQSVTAQPASPTDGDTYIIAATHTGTQWAGFTPGDLAIFKSGTWYAWEPTEGLVVNVAGSLFKFDGGVWVASGGGGGTWGSITGTLSAQTDLQSALDAKASIAYVDGLVQGLSWKKAVRAATTANGTLATAYESGDTIDGVVLAPGDRVLVKNQTTGSENGIYTVNASGAPTRANDADSGAELVNASVYVSEGTTLADTQWTCSTNAPITIGSTALVFAQLSTGDGFTGGALTSALDEAKGTDIVRAATTNIAGATGNFVHLTGTTTITALGTAQAGARRIVRFAGAGILTHNATSLVLPGAANITTAANDTAEFLSEGSGNWRCTNYSKASGVAVVVGGASITGFTSSLATASPNNTVNASVLLASGGTTIQDVVISPKSSGALIFGAAPDGITGGGNKRGQSAVDFQRSRSSATSVASGDQSFIAAGNDNTTSGTNAFASGSSNNSTGAQSASFGTSHIAGGINSAAFGNTCLAGGKQSFVMGTGGSSRGITNAYAHAGGDGKKQKRELPFSGETSNATPTEITTDGGAGDTTNRIVLPNYGAFKLRIEVTAYNASSDDVKSWEIKALVKQVTGSTAAIVGTPGVTVEFADSGASAWTCELSVSGTAILLLVTGHASQAVRWSATAYLQESLA